MHFDLPAPIHEKCREILDAEIQSVSYVGGGDINQARLLETSRGKFFMKMNTAQDAARMFETEAKGLAILANAGAIRIPQVIGHGDTGAGAFLLLEFIETGYRGDGFWEKFGAALAELHRHSAEQFGLDHSNFIGSLPQPNGRHDTWPAFYIHERLLPQIDLAKAENRMQTTDFQAFEKLFKKLPDLCPTEPPALTHGDLWSGNFLVSANSEPILIDPAVSYAHREMDLAMSRLFGGFGRPFYHGYKEAWPLEFGFEQRLEIYQLYYLMVHVNLFGGGYVRSVRGILERFI